jgi:hypothetical protein
MSDPTLKRARVTIAYTGSDGYRSEFSCKGGAGAVASPEKAMLASIDELARLLALFGFENQARETVEQAFTRVRESLAKRAKDTQ